MFLDIFFALVVLAGLFGLEVALSGYLEHKGRPREEMYLCDKHGAFRKSHALFITPEVPYCPQCFSERLATSKTTGFLA